MVGSIAIFYRGCCFPTINPLHIIIATSKSWEQKISVPDGASGDFTNQPARKFEQELEVKRKSLELTDLPPEPRRMSAEERESRTRERLRLTMTAHILRRSTFAAGQSPAMSESERVSVAAPHRLTVTLRKSQAASQRKSQAATAAALRRISSATARQTVQLREESSEVFRPKQSFTARQTLNLKRTEEMESSLASSRTRDYD
ncbi:hypothetical protein PoB_007154300 [Plakobranchus ocellatus]|uniref:Uncharacterized protein n=1 Tax=Plakobranchus ocellatus TaxID=259542 RepID=A0AAV4DLW6_9GAST|nr:hypothetical protein PoB_007154300 [Plakobranchus ocellatus]